MRGRRGQNRPVPSSLIIDCDPGVDDAVALLLAFASPELEVLAVTTVAGNVSVNRTTRNARILRQIAGREDVPVHAGADQPLIRALAHAADFHGVEGLGDLAPFTPDAPASDLPAVEAIIATVMARPANAVDIAVLGPMTNVALALRAEPTLQDRVRRVVVMGGAASEGGNITRFAEFNIWADPEAASEVFASRCPMVVLSLDATHQVRATETRIARIEAIDTARARAVAAMLRFSQRIERTLLGFEAAPLHDPCVIAWLLAPHLFADRPCHVEVEVLSDERRGHTEVDFAVATDAAAAPDRWVVAADGQGVFDLIAGRLEAAG